MKAFVVLNKDQELLDGQVNFGFGKGTLGEPVIYDNLSDALEQLEGKDHMRVMEFEFVHDWEVIQATNAANMGDSWNIFTVKWLKTYGRVDV